MLLVIWIRSGYVFGLLQQDRGWGRLKCETGIIGTKIAGVENAGPSSYGKPKHLRDWKCRSYFLLVTAHTT